MVDTQSAMEALFFVVVEAMLSGAYFIEFVLRTMKPHRNLQRVKSHAKSRSDLVAKEVFVTSFCVPHVRQHFLFPQRCEIYLDSLRFTEI